MATITTKETRAFNWANPGTLKVGDEIVETLKDSREVVFVVMDDGVIGLKNLLGYHRMNKDWTNEGGWLACDMRRYLNEEVIARLPDALIAAIKPRKFGEEEDKLWLFSEMEVFGEHDWTENDPDRGFQFEYFKDRRNRIKVDEDGDALWWWERSPVGTTPAASAMCTATATRAIAAPTAPAAFASASISNHQSMNPRGLVPRGERRMTLWDLKICGLRKATAAPSWQKSVESATRKSVILRSVSSSLRISRSKRLSSSRRLSTAGLKT